MLDSRHHQNYKVTCLHFWSIYMQYTFHCNTCTIVLKFAGPSMLVAPCSTGTVSNKNTKVSHDVQLTSNG